MRYILKKLQRKIKKKIKEFHLILVPPLKGFDPKKIPWIDKVNPAIDAYVQNISKEKLPIYDLAEKLKFWEKNGYVILENVIENELIDKFLRDFDCFIEERERFEIKVFVELPSYTLKRLQHAKHVSKAVLLGKYVKFLEFHNLSVSGKKLMLHPAIVTFLEAIFDNKTVGMQSLTFRYGSQQPAHQDFAFVKPDVPSHLAASWIALEDIHKDAGPLFYYEGSHKIKKFNFGNGILHVHNESKKSTDEFSSYLVDECERLHLKRKTLTIQKGDVLLWHAALVHGGDAIQNESLTRKSFICHYSNYLTYKYSHVARKKEPIVEEYNGAFVFQHPNFVKEENYYK